MTVQDPATAELGEILHCRITEPKAAAEIDFGDLIAPLDHREFFADYWEKKPFLSRGRLDDFFAPLFSIADVDRAISYLKPKPGRLDLVSEHGFVRDNFLGPDGTASVGLVSERYLEGSTIILSGLEETWEPLARFTRHLEGELSHPVAMAVYLTPPDYKGVKPHYDTQENFLLQVEGTKHWRVYEPVHSLPPVEGSYTPVPREKLSEPIFEATIGPGDMLYIPRGYPHEGVAGDQASLHITVDIHVRTWHDFLSDALDQMVERDPSFRSALPASFLHDPDAQETLAQRFGELMTKLGENARLDDAIGKHTEVLAVRRAPAPDGHFARLHTEIDTGTVLRKRDTALTRTFRSNGTAGIQFSGNQLLGPAKIAGALQFITENETFTPAALPDLAAREQLVLARRLVRIGLLTIASGDDA